MTNEWKPEKNISSPWDVDVWENNIGQPVLNTSNKPTDTEILEFLLSNFQMHSPKMNGQHSWTFKNYDMKNLVGPSARDAIIACMEAQK